MIKRRNFLGYSLLFLAGWTSACQSSLDWPTQFRLGISDVEDKEVLERDYENFRIQLEDILTAQIEFVLLENIVAAAPALISGNLDLVWAGPSEYIILAAKANAIPLVTLKRPQYRTVIVVRQDSDIRSLSDLKEKTLDIWKLGSTSHLGAGALFAEANLQLRSETKIVEVDPNAQLENLLAGKFDALARGYTSYLKILKKAGLSEGERTREIASTPEWPGDIFVVSPLLAARTIAEMQSRLLEGQHPLIEAIVNIEELKTRFKGASIEIARDADFDYMREAYKAIGQESLFP